jgi:hypothetical protein
MEGLVIASQYLVSKRRLDLSEIPMSSGFTKLLVAVVVIGVVVGALQRVATAYPVVSAHNSPIADARPTQ